MLCTASRPTCDRASHELRLLFNEQCAGVRESFAVDVAREVGVRVGTTIHAAIVAKPAAL